MVDETADLDLLAVIPLDLDAGEKSQSEWGNNNPPASQLNWPANATC